MQFPTLILLLLTLTTSTSLAQERSTASYDTMYDNPNLPTDQTACSDGVNGLSKAHPTIGSIPRHPFVGASPTIPGWNSPNCGKCYRLIYGGRAIIFKAIDRGAKFVLSKQAMDTLTGGMAATLGTVSVESLEVSCT
ncbi:SnodProt1 [Morchella conica CCBAS932]|uniref:SnodProt1 n=1 Tax=Morchella conica CCBAS932 TaxID=1392247 RepID=A0A3N4KPB6_9PEZI|nr:SnodProt1 [Morchella conica CCBAS932]